MLYFVPCSTTASSTLYPTLLFLFTSTITFNLLSILLTSFYLLLHLGGSWSPSHHTESTSSSQCSLVHIFCCSLDVTSPADLPEPHPDLRLVCDKCTINEKQHVTFHVEVTWVPHEVLIEELDCGLTASLATLIRTQQIINVGRGKGA